MKNEGLPDFRYIQRVFDGASASEEFRRYDISQISGEEYNQWQNLATKGKKTRSTGEGRARRLSRGLPIGLTGSSIQTATREQRSIFKSMFRFVSAIGRRILRR
jgi:hypothetical protein